MSVLERIAEELRDLGFSPTMLCIDGLGGDQAVVIDYPVETGRFKGRTLRMGVALQEEAYPEYPPHFVWVADLSDPRLPAHSTSSCNDKVWMSFSVPPSDIWDRLPAADKNMKSYINSHLLRFWDQV